MPPLVRPAPLGRWALGEADQPELLLQLVQFCRLLQRIARLAGAPLPERIARAIGRYIGRELGSSQLLRPGCVTALLRPAPASGAALAARSSAQSGA